ncbi:MAG: methionyl-tRNA formyltransferase [Anaerolineae bacterium]|nr:methionyl-tRNA formyltransferase [Anaerolineae bacterium]
MESRIVFMGTPEFALPTLEKLAIHYSVVGVVTQPDRPAGRGQRLTPPPVKAYALAEGIPVFQPTRLRKDIAAVEKIRTWAPDLIVVAAYGLILPRSVLNISPLGVLNVHASLLPRWRGATPIQGAIMGGETVTGVTIMKMDAGIDTGPILAQREMPIGASETAGELEARLAALGAELLLEVLPVYMDGQLVPEPQPEDGITITHRLPKEAACIDWMQSAEHISRQVRAFAPLPGAYTTWKGERFKIFQAQVVPQDMNMLRLQPGTVFLWQDIPAVVTGEGALSLLQVQMAGKRPMNGALFVHGKQDFVGARLGSQQPGEY